MIKSVAGFLAGISLLGGCAAPPQSAQRQASVGQVSAVATVDSAPAETDDDYETVYVPPPVGSMLGGGSVRVAKKQITGNDEGALVGNIRRLNAAAGAKDERPYAVASISRATGVSVNELQAQQDVLQLRFGELCAINAIAHGNSNKVEAIARLRRKGQTWANVAKIHGVSIATVTQMVRNANEMTIADYSNAMERAKGGQRKLKDLGVRIQRRPGD